jgi:hypothetical protein
MRIFSANFCHEDFEEFYLPIYGGNIEKMMQPQLDYLLDDTTST